MDRYFEALTLEVSLLERLLERHRCSHGRALYFQRMSMIVRKIRRRQNTHHGHGQNLETDHHCCSILGLYQHYMTTEKAILDYSLKQTRQKQKRKRQKGKFGREKEEEEAWDRNNNINGVGLTEEQLKLQQQVQGLLSTFTERIPDILSRIEHHASPMLFLEVSRGFFLPFCTVALGMLARIRVLILRIGRGLLPKLQSMISSISSSSSEEDPSIPSFLPQLSPTKFEEVLSLFMQDGMDPNTRRKIEEEERRRNLLQLVGLTPASKKIDDRMKEKRDGRQTCATATAVRNHLNLSEKKEMIGHSSPSKATTSTTATATATATATKTEVSIHAHSTDEGEDKEEQDIGEALDFCKTPEPSSLIRMEKTETSVMKKNIEELPTDVDPMDRNMDVLNALKGSTGSSISSARGKKRRKNIGISIQDNGSKEEKDETPKPKKKKKKKKAKGDFFDSLFN